jgi:hypothetical protein
MIMNASLESMKLITDVVETHAHYQLKYNRFWRRLPEVLLAPLAQKAHEARRALDSYIYGLECKVRAVEAHAKRMEELYLSCSNTASTPESTSDVPVSTKSFETVSLYVGMGFPI